MNKKQLHRYVGSMQQLAYVRPITYTEGRASSLKGFDIKNGAMSFQVLADKCLDISQLSYKGINFNFLSKPGLQGRNQYDTNGDEALRSIMGGLLFTAGLENICAPCSIDEKAYPMHGRLRTTPGEHISSDARWDNSSYLLSVSGEMREAELFGENMLLRRTITTVFGSKTIVIQDELENQSFRDEPLMLLYHFNLGYPFLDEYTRLCIPTTRVLPRDEYSSGHEGEYDRMDPPKDNQPEYVFIHSLKSDERGDTQVLVLNDLLELGLKLEFNRQNLPYFMEWKSTASGDYALGLEPSNSSVFGRPFHESQGTLHKIPPFGTERNVLKLTVLDGPEEMQAEELCFRQKFSL